MKMLGAKAFWVVFPEGIFKKEAGQGMCGAFIPHRSFLIPLVVWTYWSRTSKPPTPPTALACPDYLSLPLSLSLLSIVLISRKVAIFCQFHHEKISRRILVKI